MRASSVKRPSRSCDGDGVALMVSDAPDWPMIEEETAGFRYVRLHGHTSMYRSRYTGGQLDDWARRILAWAHGGEPGDVYLDFDNDALGHAPWDAERLQGRLRTGGTFREAVTID